MSLRTCIVKYLPKGNKSNTAELLTQFLSMLPTDSTTEVVDLLRTYPPIFDEETLSIYLRKRENPKVVLTAIEQELFEKFEKILEPILRCDVLVLVTPMHNYSFPGIVKCYIDSIMQYGKTWHRNSQGMTEGLLKGKKALVLSSSGGCFDGGNSRNLLSPLAKIVFETMGFETDVVLMDGMAQDEQTIAQHKQSAKDHIFDIINNWYV